MRVEGYATTTCVIFPGALSLLSYLPWFVKSFT